MNTKEKKRRDNIFAECRKKVLDEVERRVKRHPMGMPDPDFINLHMDLGTEAGYNAGRKDMLEEVKAKLKKADKNLKIKRRDGKIEFSW